MMNSKQVLVVEDDADDAFLVGRTAAQAGANCEFVQNGEQTIRWLEQPHHSPDVILLDWNLPGMPAIEVIRWLRDQARFDGLEVIVWSGAVSPGQREDALAAGADRVLLKPCAFNEFERLLLALFDNYEDSAEARTA